MTEDRPPARSWSARGDWKYVRYVGLPSQLFNLANDPDERRDLADANAPEVQAALSEGERRLREICDPDAVNALCFAEWCRRIEALGGETACLNAAQFNHTPTPV